MIKTELKKVHEDCAPALNTIYYWINEYKRDCKSTFRIPIEVSSLDMIDKFHSFVIEDRRIKLREIAEKVDTSYEWVHNMKF